MFNKIINVLSLIVAIAALIATITIAIHTNKITKKQGEENTNLSRLNNKLTEKIHESVEYLSPAQIEFKVSSIKHPLRSAGYIDRNTDHYIYGTTLKIQGSLEKFHGQIIKNYIFYKKCDGTTLKQSFNNSIEIDLFSINKDDDLNYIHSHFFIVYVDSALKIHRILVEIIAKATSKSHGNSNNSAVYVPNGKEAHQESEQESGSILYRIWNEFDLVENSYKQTSNNDWKNGYTNEKENLNEKEIDDLKKQEFNSSKIMEEIKEINKTFSDLGFN
ncbi:hypothetical protein [Ligilactobacillus aviarius]|uniref:hypothetical protein n=1 Tax=Ligilactobacillus aviarius TaxID=1606 RepID=UPI00195D7FE4|nr:hypothetical protein [Ligilactobacillus aviarius]MBM6863196.1 hypothetical protein [Ligilactobacillus aviarius]